jgi:hypothetical protein
MEVSKKGRKWERNWKAMNDDERSDSDSQNNSSDENSGSEESYEGNAREKFEKPRPSASADAGRKESVKKLSFHFQDVSSQLVTRTMMDEEMSKKNKHGFMKFNEDDFMMKYHKFVCLSFISLLKGFRQTQ